MVRNTGVHLELPGYARSLLFQVIEKTGHPIVAAETPGIGYDSQLSMAVRARPFHKLIYGPEYGEFFSHFIVNAAVKILRVWELPPEERLIPVYRAGRRLPNAYEEELFSKIGVLPSTLANDLSQFLYRGTVQQLTSMPVDIRVEREMAEMLPEHRTAQQDYLTRQVQDLEPHFAEEIASVAPSRLYAATSAMNLVLAEEAAEITGVKPGPMLSRSPHRRLGECLRERLHSVREQGYRGDIMLTDMWAAELGLEDWYEWDMLGRAR